MMEAIRAYSASYLLVSSFIFSSHIEKNWVVRLRPQAPTSPTQEPVSSFTFTAVQPVSCSFSFQLVRATREVLPFSTTTITTTKWFVMLCWWVSYSALHCSTLPFAVCCGLCGLLLMDEKLCLYSSENQAFSILSHLMLTRQAISSSDKLHVGFLRWFQTAYRKVWKRKLWWRPRRHRCHWMGEHVVVIKFLPVSPAWICCKQGSDCFYSILKLFKTKPLRKMGAFKPLIIQTDRNYLWEKCFQLYFGPSCTVFVFLIQTQLRYFTYSLLNHVHTINSEPDVQCLSWNMFLLINQFT